MDVYPLVLNFDVENMFLPQKTGSEYEPFSQDEVTHFITISHHLSPEHYRID
jgi:hypothetical protein